MKLPLTETEALNKNSQNFDKLPMNKMAEVMCAENFTVATAVQKAQKEGGYRMVLIRHAARIRPFRHFRRRRGGRGRGRKRLPGMA